MRGVYVRLRDTTLVEEGRTTECQESENQHVRHQLLFEIPSQARKGFRRLADPVFIEAEAAVQVLNRDQAQIQGVKHD